MSAIDATKDPSGPAAASPEAQALKVQAKDVDVWTF